MKKIVQQKILDLYPELKALETPSLPLGNLDLPLPPGIVPLREQTTENSDSSKFIEV